MFPWKSIFNLDKNHKRPIFLQIVDVIISEVSKGRIKTGDLLPGSRRLAQLLSLNRKTVILAYDELLAQGWIEIRPSKGTYIKNTLPLVSAKHLNSPSIIKSLTIEKDTTEITSKVINDGTPDFRLAPLDKLYKQARFVSKGIIGKSVLVGDHSRGEGHLRHTLTDYLQQTRGISGNIENVMVTRGSQMSIYLAFSQILAQRDSVIVGSLNYQTANQTITSLGGQLIKVPVNHEGLEIDEIAKVLKKKKVKAIYVTPHHHYPTTVTMPVENRLQLLELANKYNFYIIEDDYDYDYHYLRSPILPIASIDQTERVVYIGSFSKLLAPSIRIGYMHAPKSLIDQCAKQRLLLDRRGDPILERSLSDLINENELSRSLKKTIPIYKHRRDLMCSILKEGLGQNISFNKPDGGMAVWVELANTPIDDLKKETLKSGLKLEIDTYHYTNHCRLGFASMNDHEIQENCKLLISSILIHYKT
ncbi:MAG: PLP-dependent aminotransferase family protein [Reichenbachiella sp.]